MRLFVALDLPDSVCQSLDGWRLPLADVRWTPPERMHLTLRFLGETDEPAAARITDRLSLIEAPPVPIRSEGMIHLPSARRPRVLAVRIQETSALLNLHKAVEDALSGVGVPPEGRPLLPHVTVARTGHLDPAALRRVIRETEPPGAEGTARSFSLYRSDPEPDGPRYTALLTIPLQIG